MPTRARTASGCVGDVEAVDRRVPLGRRDERGQQPDRRGLARAVRARAGRGPRRGSTSRSMSRIAHSVPETPAEAGRADHDGIGRGHPAQSDRAWHNRLVTRPWNLPEVTGIGRLPMHSVDHHERVPLDGRWRFQLLRSPDDERRPRVGRGGRPEPLDDGGHLGPPALHERPDAVRGPPAGRSRSSTRPASTSASSRSRRLLGRTAGRAPRRCGRERPDRRRSTARRSASARTRTSPRNST